MTRIPTNNTGNIGTGERNLTHSTKSYFVNNVHQYHFFK